MSDFASTETIEVLDRIVGNNYLNLSPNDTFDALIAFSSAKVAIVR